SPQALSCSRMEGDMSTRSSQPIDDQVDDTGPTSSGGSVAGVVIALLLIGVVIVVVVYRVRTKKTDDPVWRFFITANRAGARQVNNYHDADYEEDAVLKNARKKVPVNEDKEEMVMIDNIVYEGGKPLPKTAQVAENDYEDIKCLQQPTVTSASADTDHQGDDDEEVVMIDNVAYEGTRLQKDNYQHIRAPQRSPKGSQANNGRVPARLLLGPSPAVLLNQRQHDATKPATDGGVDDSSLSGEYGVCTAGVSPRSTQNASETPESTQTVSTSPDLSLKLEVGIIIIVLGGVTILGLFATVITTIVVCGKRHARRRPCRAPEEQPDDYLTPLKSRAVVEGADGARNLVPLYENSLLQPVGTSAV
ncbi:hypothetical protein BaRGS_00031943, partial [Batillaria attramentaria]